MSICKMRASNVNKRLGLLDTPQKQRTPAEKKANDKLMANVWAEREAAASQALHRVSELEEKMKNKQTAVKATVAKHVHLAAKKKSSTPDVAKGANPQMIGGMEVLPSGELLNSTLDNEEVTTKARKTTSNTLLHEALHYDMAGKDAREKCVEDSTKPAATPDDTLIGHIQGWAANIAPHGKKITRRKSSTSSKMHASTATSPPPSKTLLGTTTPPSSINDIAPQAEDALVGRFDDEEMEDDTLERAAVVTFDEASQLPDTILAITITDDESLDNAEAPPPSQKRPWAISVMENENKLLDNAEAPLPLQKRSRATSIMENGSFDLGALPLSQKRPWAIGTLEHESFDNIEGPPPSQKKDRHEENPSNVNGSTGSICTMTQVERAAESVKKEVLRPTKKVKTNLELHTKSGGSDAVIPTLCLWAAAQSDIWGISKQQILSIVKDIIAAAYPKDLNLSEQVTLQSKLVAVAYQRLCDWRHSIGSAALSMWVSFFSKLDSASVAEEAKQLLDQHRYLYLDLDYSDMVKAFKFYFIVCLLTSIYPPQIKGWIDVPPLNCPALHHSGIKGILGLCVSALQRGLHMMANDELQLEADAKGKNLKTPTMVNKALGKVSMNAYAFSDQNWGEVT